MDRILRIGLIVGLMMSSMIAFAQQNGKVEIKGSVVDKTTGNPLEFATVLLRDTTGKVIQGETTDSKGNYMLMAPVGNWVMEVAFIGYTTDKLDVKITPQKTHNVPSKIEVLPEDKEIDAVVVTGKKPPIERRIDMLVMNVESIISAETSTGLELLRQAPGVSIDNEGNITLNGKSVQVWIDGRPSHLSGQELVALLESTEGANIDKIEIINNPSSKYDAAGGGGIINIKTKKSFANGLNGNARLGYKQFFEDDFYYRGNGSIALNYRSDKISTYINYGARAGNGFSQLKEKMFIRDTLRRNTEMDSDDDFMNHSAKFGLDYFLNKKNTIGAIANFSYRKSGDDGITNTTLFDGGPISLDSSRTESTSGRTFVSGSLNLNYTHNFDKEQQELTTNLDYRRYTSKPWQNQNTQFFKSGTYPEIFKNNTNQTIDIYGAKVDYVHPINDRMRLEVGGKIEQTNTDNRIVRMDFDAVTGEDTLNLNESNDFKYYERITALYANYSWSIDSMWSVKAGLRYENTWSKGDWITEGSVTKKKYNNLFPTLFIGFNPSQNHNFGLSYTRRINRPGYWNLNPFRRYMDPYTYFQGNPNLDPAYSHRVNLEYNLFKFINLSLGYNYTKDMIIQIPESLPNNMTAYTQGNFGKNQDVSFNIYLSQVPIAKWWSMNFSIWMAYIMNENYNYSNSSFGGNIWTNNTFTLSKTIKAELEFWANTPMTWGYFETKFQGSLNLGVKKSFWNNTASLSIYFDDVLGTSKFSATTRIDDTRREVKNSWESRAVRFAFTYRFGQASQSAPRRNVGQQDDAGRVGGGGDK